MLIANGRQGISDISLSPGEGIRGKLAYAHSGYTALSSASSRGIDAVLRKPEPPFVRTGEGARAITFRAMRAGLATI